ncbi:MAG: hemerythrin domain-containing protein [Gammaproteobacteria bacterium]|nr:hemerythrin domain-containing protein [Gammaproteobacteria bacterium]MDH5777832.1 hemerythrin domain-containing protein [Gammaproteobacteria bacterium]
MLSKIISVAESFSLSGLIRHAHRNTSDISALNIPFKPTLVQELMLENRAILAGFKLIKEKILENDIETVRRLLVNVKKAVLNHFIKEKISLCMYIKAHNVNNSDRLEKLTTLKQEMDAVQAMAFKFFSTYINGDIMIVQNIESMSKELEVIAEVIDLRLHREEKELFPMYVANDEE